MKVSYSSLIRTNKQFYFKYFIYNRELVQLFKSFNSTLPSLLREF